ncbi:MAG: NYN domain-containing protein [Mycobacteriaceae bacterium]|uniref:NYN domain-containing protein n=1 Tax=Corynebacterium sp. TaxID=1720 RepID=UPI003F9AB277
MLERTLIYVDTSYLLASFYNAWATGARSQLEIDLPEVVNVLGTRTVNQLGQPVHRQNWYDGIPDSGPHRYQRALRSCPGVQLRAGQLIEWGDRRTQKAVDTRLVADMVLSAANHEVTDIVLVSGDADMLPGVDEAVSRGIRVHLYGFGWDSMSANLRYACDTTTILDPREDFADCMRLEVLEGPLKTGGTTGSGSAGGSGTPQHKPIGDAEPVEDLSGTSAVPDVRRRRSTESTESEGSTESAEPAESAGIGDNNGSGATGSTENPGAAENTPEPPAVPPVATVPTEPPAPATIGDETCEDIQPVESTVPVETAPTDGPDDASADTSGTGEDTSGRSSTPSPADLAAPKPAQPSRPVPSRPTPAMMASRRRLRSRYVPLPTEIWQSGGQQTPFDIGEQYAIWWYQHAATDEQQRSAHVLSGGGLPPEIDRPLLQFACETLHEYTLTEHQRVDLRDGFHSGVRGIVMKQ